MLFNFSFSRSCSAHFVCLIMQDLRFSCRWLWRVLPFGVHRHAVRSSFACYLLHACFLLGLCFNPEDGVIVPLKHWLTFTGLPGIIFQKTWIFISTSKSYFQLFCCHTGIMMHFQNIELRFFPHIKGQASSSIYILQITLPLIFKTYLAS